MGFRFRKSLKIAPGVKLNFNKKSTGITFGGKGFHYTVNSKGKKTTSVGIPGTGLYYTTTSGGNSKKKSNKSIKTQGSAYNMDTANTKKWYQKTGYIILFLIIFFPVGLFLMWKYTNWNKYVKIAISALIALFAIIGLASPSDSEDIDNVNSSIAEESSNEVVFAVNVTDETTTEPETTTKEETTTIAETTTKDVETTTHAETTTKAVTTTRVTTTKSPVTTTKETTTVKATGRTVYITPKGERYHYDPDCGGKNSYAVSIDNVGSRTPCKKCTQ